MTTSTVGRTMTPSELFSLKWPATARQVDFRCHKCGITRHDAEDLRQTAAMHLWQHCVKATADGTVKYEVTTEYAVLLGLTAALRSRDRHQAKRLPSAGRMPAPVASVQVDGVRLTMTDAAIDQPEVIETVSNGYSPGEAAALLGVTRERIRQIQPTLGAVRLGGRIRLSRRLVDACAAARQTRRSCRCGTRTR
ncbi:MAG: hypothetical protein AMXMBFR13_49300 [Phycisphaerae bacterium]